jgi:CheY-like chemotaxis protein
VEKAYKRIDKMETKIQSAKLPYNAWKVLFVLDKESSAEEIASLLGEEVSIVEQALERLAGAGLLETAEVLEKATEAEITDVVAEETMEAPEVQVQEEPKVEQPEEEPAIWPEVEPVADEEEQPEVVVEEKSSAETIEEPDLEKVEEPAQETVPEKMEEPEETAAEKIDDLITEIEPVSAPEEDLSSEIDLEPEKTTDTKETVSEELVSEEQLVEETVDKGTPDEEAEKPAETIMDSFPSDDFDVVIPTEPDTPTEEKESLDVDFELQQPVLSEEAEAPAPEAEPTAQEGKKTILVIDDSIVIRKMVEIALEDEDEIAIETSVSGKEGLNKLDEVNVDLVILDMMLPDISGVDILKTIKASKGIPVIILSGKDSPQLVEKAKSEGADEFLPKPFKDDELVEKIKNLLKL